MKIAQNWITTTPTILLNGSTLTGFDISNLNQSPDEVILSERTIFEGTSASFSMTTSTVPQDVMLFDFLGNRVDLNITYTNTSGAAITRVFPIEDELSTTFSDWSTNFQTQSTNHWTDLDHLVQFADASPTTTYDLVFVIRTFENAANDIKGEISAWANSSFDSATTYIPLGSRVIIGTTTYHIEQIFGNGTATNSVVLSGTPPSTGTVNAIYRPLSLSKCLVSTNTLEVNNPHWGMSRKRNIVQSNTLNHRGRLIPLNRPGIKYDSYTLTTGFQDLMSEDFINHLQADGTSARPMQIISENVVGPAYGGREWIIFGQFEGLPSETLDARNHRLWSMDIVAGII